MMAKNNTRCAGRTRRIMLALCALTCAAAAVLASCGKKGGRRQHRSRYIVRRVRQHERYKRIGCRFE